MGHDEARALIDQGRDPAAIGHEYWSPASDGFRRSITKIFVLGGQNKNVRVAVGRPLRVSVQRAGEDDPSVDFHLGGDCLQAFSEAVTLIRSGQHQHTISRPVSAPVPLRKDLQQQIRTLFRDKTSQKEHQLRFLRYAPLVAERTGGGGLTGKLDPVSANDNFRVRDSAFQELLALLLRGGDNAGSSLKEAAAERAVIKPLHPNAAYNWPEHAHWFHYIWNFQPAAGGGYTGSQEVVEAINVNKVVCAKPLAAERGCAGIPSQGAIPCPRSKINRLHAVFSGFESPLAGTSPYNLLWG